MEKRNIYKNPSKFMESLRNQIVEGSYIKPAQDSDTESMSLVKSSISEQSKFLPMFYNTCYYQVRSGKLLKYEHHEFIARKNREQIEMLNKGESGSYCGEISSAAIRNIKKKVEIWYDAITIYNAGLNDQLFQKKRRLTFVTLTLSATQFHSDKEIKESILKPFLRKIKTLYSAWNYIWKAEKQVNGNIHFHVIMDVFIDKLAVQEIWNNCQENLGYITEFSKKFKHANPPSTKIEAVDNFEKAAKYLSKYLSKEGENGTIEGAIWKASKSVSTLQFFEFVSDFMIDKRLDDAVDRGDITYNCGERYAFYNTDVNMLRRLLPERNLIEWDSYKSYLCEYLFSGERSESFHFHCLFDHGDKLPDQEKRPLIARIEYPENIQLKLWDQQEIELVKNAGLLSPKFGKRISKDYYSPEWIRDLIR